MTEETYDQLIRRLRNELESLGTRNVIVHLKDGTNFKAQLATSVEESVNHGAFYYQARNEKGQLWLSTKVSLQKIDRFERDRTEYPVFFYGGGNPV